MPTKSSNIGSISTAQVYFNDQGTPVSSQFDDIYFNTDNGLEESRYVFLAGNDLTQRFTSLQSGSQPFVIAETGFGSGLNFLATWQLFNDSGEQHPTNQRKLHFISFEKYPLSIQDIRRTIERWPELNPYAQQLLNQYPKPFAGCHRLEFEQGTVILDLWFGDIQQTLPQLFQSQTGYVDAWFLDGFAPSKNAGMWCDKVYQGMQILAKTNASLATFTCARIVRDGLEQAGFALKKRKGFGKKREMLTGRLSTKPSVKITPPFHYRQANDNNNQQIAIVGGGIASACLCYALAKRGYQITLLCKDSALSLGASQNRQGALYPLLQADDNALGAFYAHGYQYALRLYRQLLRQGLDFEHQFCGVLLQGFDPKSTEQQQNLMDTGLWSCLYQAVDAKQASDIAKLDVPHGGLYFPEAGWIYPASLVNALIKAAKQLTQVDIKFNYQVSQLNQLDNGHWQVNHRDTFAQLTICCGHLSAKLSQTQALQLSPIRGQVSHLDATAQSRRLSTVLCNSGYTTPALDGQHRIGASFIKGDTSVELRDKEHEKNLERFASGFATEHHRPPWLNELQLPTEGKAAIRCASIDHLPLAGAVPDSQAYKQAYEQLWKGLRPHCYPTPPDHTNLYILTALGARGLCSAPLAAEILAAQLTNTPYPVATNVLNALNPGRGLIKRLKRKSVDLTVG